MKSISVVSLLILNIIYVFGQNSPSVPQLPTSFNATVQFTMTAYGMPFSLTGPFYYDITQNAMRIDGQFFGQDFIDLYRFDLGLEYQIAGGTCNVQNLTGPIYPFDVPPFATFVGMNNINGVQCETFKVNFMGTLQMVFYVANITYVDGKVGPVLNRVMVNFDQISQQYDFSNVVPGIQDPELFDPMNFGCPNPHPPPSYTVAGYIRDAVTAQTIPNAVVSLGILTTTTDSYGMYTFTGVEVNYYSLNASAANYVTGEMFINVTTNVNPGTFGDIYLSPTLPAGDWRVVLTWGYAPADLDAWVFVPWHTCHVFWNNRQCTSGSTTVSLDRDARNGWGPETITIKNLSGYGAGNFTYFVNDYSGGSFAYSNAKVALYNQNGLYQTWTVPTFAKTPSEYWYYNWVVFNIAFNGDVVTLDYYSMQYPPQ